MSNLHTVQGDSNKDNFATRLVCGCGNRVPEFMWGKDLTSSNLTGDKD